MTVGHGVAGVRRPDCCAFHHDGVYYHLNHEPKQSLLPQISVIRSAATRELKNTDSIKDELGRVTHRPLELVYGRNVEEFEVVA